MAEQALVSVRMSGLFTLYTQTDYHNKLNSFLNPPKCPFVFCFVFFSPDQTHGFNSAGRFLTTYKKDYGPVRERYPHLNSRDEVSELLYYRLDEFVHV